MKKTITFLCLMFLGLGLHAQEYVMQVYQGGTATSYLVSSVDSMYFYSDGYTFSLEWPMDNFETNVFSVSTDDMNTICMDFDATWDDLKAALTAGTVKLYGAGTDAVDYTVSTTADAGFYFDASGAVCEAGATECGFFIKANTTGETLAFDFSFYPYEEISESPFTAGDVVTFQLYVADESQAIDELFTFSITIQDAGTILWNPSYEKSGVMTYSVSLQPNDEYASLSIALDSTEIASALGLENGSAVIAGLADSTIVFHGVNADGSLYDGTTANNYGCWYSTAGDVSTWGDGCALFVESASTSDPFTMNIGEYPSACTVGDTYTVKQAFVKLSDDSQATITYNVTIVGNE